jgi:phosphatidyl-myo-inositol dimannoside synthase
MPKVLIVTNDFPPRTGGIQSFVYALAMQLADQVVVYAPAWKGATEFDRTQPFLVVRHPTSLMLPSPFVRQRAVAIMRSEGCDRVLFGAAAPLGLLAPALRRAGARRIIAVTHGHEASWAALPIAKALLRRIGDSVDTVTYLGDYFQERLAKGLSRSAARRMVKLAPGVNTNVFRPGDGSSVRSRLGLGERPVILCVSRLVARKGQDVLIRAMPNILEANDHQPILLLVGSGPYATVLHRIARENGVTKNIVFAGEVSTDALPDFYNAANIFAMPCRTRRGGLEVEGLGIVFLEAASSGLPVIAGDSGGAPDAVLANETGFVIQQGHTHELVDRLNFLLANRAIAKSMGANGRAWMERSWQWTSVRDQLKLLLELE